VRRTEIVGWLAILAAIGLAALLAAPRYHGTLLYPGTGTADVGEADAWQLFERIDVALLVAAIAAASAIYFRRPGLALVGG
jgi:hypothetical protein